MRRNYAISPHPGRFCSSSGAAIESLRHFFILIAQDLPSSKFSIDSAAKRFIAGSENRPVIAAVNRCNSDAVTFQV
jgi:hypothetical protein